MSLLTQPNDILVSILEELTVVDLIALLATCRQLKDFIANNITILYNDTMILLTLKAVLKYFPRVDRVINVSIDCDTKQNTIGKIKNLFGNAPQYTIDQLKINMDTDLTLTNVSIEDMLKLVNLDVGTFRIFNDKCILIVNHNDSIFYMNDQMRYFLSNSSKIKVIDQILTKLSRYILWDNLGEKKFVPIKIIKWYSDGIKEIGICTQFIRLLPDVLKRISSEMKEFWYAHCQKIKSKLTIEEYNVVEDLFLNYNITSVSLISILIDYPEFRLFLKPDQLRPLPEKELLESLVAIHHRYVSDST